MYLVEDYEVISWIKYGDKLYKKKNDEVSFIASKRALFSQTPKQNSGAFGELLFYHYCLKNKIEAWKCPIKNGYKPDYETQDGVYEIKTGLYKTTGTAHEKIFGTPFKYCEIPKIYKKPLYIVCIGRAEKFIKNFINTNKSIEKDKFLQFFNDNDIYFIYFSDYFN